MEIRTAQSGETTTLLDYMQNVGKVGTFKSDDKARNVNGKIIGVDFNLGSYVIVTVDDGNRNLIDVEKLVSVYDYCDSKNFESYIGKTGIFHIPVSHKSKIVGSVKKRKITEIEHQDQCIVEDNGSPSISVNFLVGFQDEVTEERPKVKT
ncbi:MAG TPA: hypothetical protein VK528_11975, partial [Flavobacterium sp.]|nr:hypothetical protein [Flavobacterium sp.]